MPYKIVITSEQINKEIKEITQTFIAMFKFIFLATVGSVLVFALSLNSIQSAIDNPTGPIIGSLDLAYMLCKLNILWVFVPIIGLVLYFVKTYYIRGYVPDFEGYCNIIIYGVIGIVVSILAAVFTPIFFSIPNIIIFNGYWLIKLYKTTHEDFKTISNAIKKRREEKNENDEAVTV